MKYLFYRKQGPNILGACIVNGAADLRSAGEWVMKNPGVLPRTGGLHCRELTNKFLAGLRDDAMLAFTFFPTNEAIGLDQITARGLTDADFPDGPADTAMRKALRPGDLLAFCMRAAEEVNGAFAALQELETALIAIAARCRDCVPERACDACTTAVTMAIKIRAEREASIARLAGDMVALQ